VDSDGTDAAADTAGGPLRRPRATPAQAGRRAGPV
jgi:hypothetical protein